MRTRFLIPPSSLTVLLLLTAAAQATTATIGGAGDANIASDVNDATIYARAPASSNGAGPGMFAGTDGTGLALRSLLWFDVADSVPVGATIFNVQVDLVLGFVSASGGMGGPGPTDINVELHKLAAAWGEGTTGSTATMIGGTGQGFAANAGDATWNASFYPSTLWTSPGGDYAAAASAVAPIGTTINVGSTWDSTPALVADVQGWIDNPSSNFGWELINSDETDIRTLRAFWTSEATDPAVRPELLVTYATLPGDANLDHVVNGLDIAAVASNWLHTGLDTPGDANGDRVVNGLDIALIASHWLSHENSAAAVPEPAGGILAALAAIASLSVVRGSRQQTHVRPAQEHVHT